MSDNEYERFEINDYDLQNEFNPNRRGRRNTKKQQIYGVFAEDDSDDDTNAGGQQRGGRGRAAAPKDYTAHVPFVSGGIQGKKKVADKEVKTKTAGAGGDDADDNDGDSASNDSAADGDGDGAEDATTASKPRRTIAHTSSESEDEARPAHSGFGMASMAGFRQHGHGAAQPTVAGAKWDAHTKGIGAKLLLKMGYQPGRGLGKDLQGIAQPVQAHLRKGRGAIGAYGAEKGQTIGDGGKGGQSAKPKVDEDQREREEFEKKMHQWRKSDDSKQQQQHAKSGRAPRYSYKSVQDVIDKGQSKKNYILSDRMSAKLSNVTVIDMTGPEKRVLSGYHALGHQTKPDDALLYEHRAAKRCDNFSMPELQHNLQLIVDMCEQDIISIDKAQRSAADEHQLLERQQRELQQIVELERAQLTSLELAMRLVDSLVEPPAELTLDEAARLFVELQRNYAAEYEEFALADLAPGVVAPLIAMELRDWRPLDEPDAPTAMLLRWKRILGDPSSERSAATTTNAGKTAATINHHFDPYSALCWASVIPHVRRAIDDVWDPRDQRRVAALLAAWSPVWPTWQLDNVLEQMVLPRIGRAVAAWDPLTDCVPVHVWIVPWQQLLDAARLEETVYQPIRAKLAAALGGWQPADRSARAMLTPWQGVWPPAAMEQFVVRHVLPKLQAVLAEMPINPIGQDLERWAQVAEWRALVPAALMCAMLERVFFPRWLQTLVMWLNQAPNLEQVSRWYSGWKGQMAPEWLEAAGVKEQFSRALGLMQRTLSGGGGGDGTTTMPMPSMQPAAMPPPMHQHAMPTATPPMAMMIDGSSVLAAVAPPPPQLDFRELVSQKCAERGIMFVPMPGRREQGKQVYRVGKLFCYIERAVIMLSDGALASWTPVSLQAMLDRAVGGSL